MQELVSLGDVGIDLHTGSAHRSNLPQIRGDLSDERTRELAEVFGAPLALHARVRDGSLREASVRHGVCTLLYEGGQAWRFDQDAIDVGVAGVRRVLAHLDMIPDTDSPLAADTLLIKGSSWLRAPRSGVARMLVDLGDVVEPRQPVAVVGDAYGSTSRTVNARHSSLVIARLEQPVVHRGDALVHLAPLSGELT